MFCLLKYIASYVLLSRATVSMLVGKEVSVSTAQPERSIQ